MPAIANITALNAAAANVTFVALEPASAAGPATWRADALSTVAGHRPVFTMLSRSNAKKDGRVHQLVVNVPVIRSINSVPTIVGYIPFRDSVTVGNEYSDAEVADAVAYHASLRNATLIKDSIKAGFAPT